MHETEKTSEGLSSKKTKTETLEWEYVRPL